VKNNPNIISQESAYINTFYGAYGISKNNDDVLGFYANQKTIKYFPSNLHEFFKNLKAIHFDPSQLEEIHQSDLKHFPDLVHFDLVYNSIEVIEEGLFDYNPNLQFVRLYESKIVHIDPNVFDHLDKLIKFYFNTVSCFNQNVEGSRDKVLDAIKEVKAKCTSNEFLDLEQKIKMLKNDSKILNLEDFSQKIQSFEKGFKNSKFSKFRPLKEKFENLKMTTGCSNCAQMVKITAIDNKLDYINENLISGDLKNISSKIDDLASQCGAKLDIKPLNDTLDGYMTDLQNKLVKFEEKMEENFMNFEVRIAEKIDKDLANTRHKIAVNLDEKLRGIEKRLMSKFEEILEEKLEKILEEKLKNVFDARFRNK